MKKFIQYLILPALGGAALLPLPVLAHCPLCTAGAGVVALGAYWLGVKAVTIGVVLGGLATVMGIWFGRLIKKQFVPYQRFIIVALSWILTIYPLRMLFADYASRYINWSGSYGSLLNRTYAVNLFLVGAVVGTIAIAVAPAAGRLITKIRGGKKFPFQSVAVSLVLLILFAVILQFI